MSFSLPISSLIGRH
jgi:hypothetical protein